MSSQIKCSFKIENWEEILFSRSESGPKLNRASVSQSYSGDLEAKSTIEYLMTTFENDYSSFIGIEEVIGKLEGRSGSFLLEHEGSHENGVAKSAFKIIQNSGSGELEGIRGEGTYEATHKSTTFALDYYFEE